MLFGKSHSTNHCPFQLNNLRPTTKHPQKKKPHSSDEQTNEEQRESRITTSLKLFHGIKLLQYPEPQIQTQYQQQSVAEVSLDTPFTLKGFKSDKIHSQVIAVSQVKMLVAKTIESCQQMFIKYAMKIQQHLTTLNSSIASLDAYTHSLPLSLQQIQNTRNRHIFQSNYQYQKDIEDLNSRMAQLQKQITTSQIPSSKSNTQKLCSLRVVPMTTPNFQQHPRSLPQCILHEEAEEIEEKSLLDGIDQELNFSGLRQNLKKQTNLFPSICSSIEPTEQTVKKEQKQLGTESLSQYIPQTTIKKHKFTAENDPILMSFAKNHDIMIVEEEMLSSGIDEQSESDRQLQKGQSKKFFRDKNLQRNPQKSLNFNSPVLFRQSTLQYSPYEESQVEEFAIRESSPAKKYISQSRKVPSLIEQACFQEEMVLSKEQKYLLGQINQLRNVLEWEEDNSKDKWEEGQSEVGLRKSIGNKEMQRKYQKAHHQLIGCREKLVRSEGKEKQLIKLLKKTQKQLAQMKDNLQLLMPCQQCDLKNFLDTID